MADVERTRRILAIELLLKRIMTLQHEQDVARETIRRLVEVARKLIDKYDTAEYHHLLDRSTDRSDFVELQQEVDGYYALLAELEGKGPQLTESHGK